MVTRWEVLGIAINDVVGSGVYLLPAAAAALVGGASLWATLAAGLAVALLALCFAEAASRFDEPGGGYLYAREARARARKRPPVWRPGAFVSRGAGSA